MYTVSCLHIPSNVSSFDGREDTYAGLSHYVDTMGRGKLAANVQCASVDVQIET